MTKNNKKNKQNKNNKQKQDDTTILRSKLESRLEVLQQSQNKEMVMLNNSKVFVERLENNIQARRGRIAELKDILGIDQEQSQPPVRSNGKHKEAPTIEADA